MPMHQRIYANAGDQVQIALAGCVVDIAPLAARQHQRMAGIILKQVLLLQVDNRNGGSLNGDGCGLNGDGLSFNVDGFDFNGRFHLLIIKYGGPPGPQPASWPASVRVRTKSDCPNYLY